MGDSGDPTQPINLTREELCILSYALGFVAGNGTIPLDKTRCLGEKLNPAFFN